MLKDKISSIIKISYLKSFSNIKEINLVDWKSTIKNYSLYYGIDSDLRNVAKKVGFENELYKTLAGIDRYGYRKYDFVDDIISYTTKEKLKEEKKVHTRAAPAKNYIAIVLVIIVFIILVKVVTLIFDTAIEDYKKERRQSPYKLFEKWGQ